MQGYSSAPTTKRDFLAPFEKFHDLLTQGDQLKFGLQDLLHRYEGALATKLSEVSDFKSTANRANALIINLQQSADNIQEMVRYEIGRAGAVGAGPAAGNAPGGLNTAERKELEELRERMKRLEDMVLGGGASSSSRANNGEGDNKSDDGREKDAQGSGGSRGKKGKISGSGSGSAPGSGGTSGSGPGSNGKTRDMEVDDD